MAKHSDVGNECSLSNDLSKVDYLDSTATCASDKINHLGTSLEDDNCNITHLSLSSNEKLVLDDKPNSNCTKKGRPNVIGMHVGPNGLINGLEIENSASLSHLFEHLPRSDMHEPLCKSSPTFPTLKLPSDRNCLDSEPSEKKLQKRTDLDTDTADQDCSIKTEKSVFLSKDVLDPSRPSKSEVETSENPGIEYVSYRSELQMPDIMRLIQKDLSEPYSIYTYRYFIHNWPKLCFLAMDGSTCVGAIVCKLDLHRKVVKRGYIAMLAVDEKYRKRNIGSNLVLKAIRAMIADDADEVVLETEITNRPALRLYENLGFVRDKRLFRYYLNGVDALRLKLWLR